MMFPIHKSWNHSYKIKDPSCSWKISQVHRSTASLPVLNQPHQRERRGGGDWWEQPTFLCMAFTECEKGFQQDRESSCCHDSTGKPRDWKGLHQLTAAILCQRNCAACLHTDNRARGMPACQISLVLLCKIPFSCPLKLEYSCNRTKMELSCPPSSPFNTSHTFCSSIWFNRGST